MTTITEEQYGKFDEQGYILVEGILDDDLLRRARDAADRAEAETQDDWNKWKDDPDRFKSYGNGPTAHVIEPILQHDDVFLDILEHPVATRFAREMQGSDMMMIDNAYHVKVAGTRAHTKWHRDAPRWAHEVENFTPENGAAWDATRRCDTPHFKIKIFYLLDDVDEETGPFSVVPGTHREDDGACRLGRHLERADLAHRAGQHGHKGPADAALQLHALRNEAIRLVHCER